MTDSPNMTLQSSLRGQKCPGNCADDAPDCACALAEVAADEIDRLREALVYIGNTCIRHDKGDETGRALGHIADHARAALEPRK